MDKGTEGTEDGKEKEGGDEKRKSKARRSGDE